MPDERTRRQQNFMQDSKEIPPPETSGGSDVVLDPTAATKDRTKESIQKFHDRRDAIMEGAFSNTWVTHDPKDEPPSRSQSPLLRPHTATSSQLPSVPSSARIQLPFDSPSMPSAGPALVVKGQSGVLDDPTAPSPKVAKGGSIRKDRITSKAWDVAADAPSSSLRAPDGLGLKPVERPGSSHALSAPASPGKPRSQSPRPWLRALRAPPDSGDVESRPPVEVIGGPPVT